MICRSVKYIWSYENQTFALQTYRKAGFSIICIRLFSKHLEQVVWFRGGTSHIYRSDKLPLVILRVQWEMLLLQKGFRTRPLSFLQQRVPGQAPFYFLFRTGLRTRLIVSLFPLGPNQPCSSLQKNQLSFIPRFRRPRKSRPPHLFTSIYGFTSDLNFMPGCLTGVWITTASYANFHPPCFSIFLSLFYFFIWTHVFFCIPINYVYLILLQFIFSLLVRTLGLNSFLDLYIIFLCSPDHHLFHLHDYFNYLSRASVS